MTRTVLVTDYAWPSLEIERATLAGVDAQLLVAETGNEDELVALAPRADAILTNWKKVPSAALDAASRCVVVSRYGVGVDNIPVDRATELGIVVTNVPDFCLDEVSDHAMALLLACARRVVGLRESTRSGRWETALAYGTSRLRGQTLGLVGFGNIARRLAPKARAFGLRVVAYTPRSTPGTDGDVERTDDLGRLLAESDYVSLHAPATAETRGLIGESALRAMKPTAYLVNTSRGALVDEEALVRALEEGWIAGAALDVLTVEPGDAGNPLMSLPNVIVTPHVAFYSEQAIEELQLKAASNVASVLSGTMPATIVNPAVLDRSSSLRAAR
jgi:D-3-phosphoglycerate dehydrogenase / 2-oxoglutarate reductase